MASPRPSEEQWELLKTTIELAEGLQITFIACADEGVEDTLRERLCRFCEETGRPWRAPGAGQNVLDWLSEVQQEPPESARDGTHAAVLFLPLARQTEGFILHRLNENRDNLRRDLRGVLCIVGDRDVLRRAPSEAPDLWDVRTRAFELAAPAEPTEAPAPSPTPTSAVTAPRYDVFLSSSRRDFPLVNVLCSRLRRDGVEVAVDVEAAEREGVSAVDGIAASRLVVVALSPDYETAAWPAIEPLFADERAGLAARTVVVKRRETMVPDVLRGLHVFDWSSRWGRARAYERLLAWIQGRKRRWWHRVNVSDGVVGGVPFLVLIGIVVWRLLAQHANIKACEEGGSDAVERCVSACEHRTDAHMPSCTRAGEMIEKSAGGQVKEEERALSFYKRACDATDAAGCARQGKMYEEGKAALRKNDERAVELYRRACDGGSMLGCERLGGMYAYGKGGVGEDPKKAVGLYQRACDGGSMSGCTHLGTAFQYGEEGFPKDDKKAIELYQRACDGGGMLGCSNLGVAFAYGHGGLAPDEKAAELYRRACDGGSMGGCSRLGVSFEEGTGGLSKDEKKAVELYQRACDGEDMLGCMRLGVSFEKGAGGLPKDEKKAVQLYQRVCDGEGMLGCSKLGVFFEKGAGGLPKDEKKAVELYQRACDGGVSDGCSALGLALVDGTGVPRDRTRGIDLLREGCSGGNTWGCDKLKDLNVPP